MSEGFDSLSHTVQSPLDWRNVRLLEELGYWVQSASIRRELVQLQMRVGAIRAKFPNLPIPENFAFSPLNCKITAFVDSVSDYASIPRILWPLFAPGEIKRPAIFHDLGYRLLWFLRNAGKISRKVFRHFRKVFDRLFREMMHYCEPPVPGWKQASAYRAVRMFGGWQRTRGKEQDLSAIKRPKRGPKHR